MTNHAFKHGCNLPNQRSVFKRWKSPLQSILMKKCMLLRVIVDYYFKYCFKTLQTLHYTLSMDILCISGEVLDYGCSNSFCKNCMWSWITVERGLCCWFSRNLFRNGQIQNLSIREKILQIITPMTNNSINALSK